MTHPGHDPNDRVWHIGKNGVYSAPRIHKGGHRRPKSVSFPTKEKALRGYLSQIRKAINTCTRKIKRAHSPSLMKAYEKTRQEYRQKEKEIVKAICSPPT